MRRILVQSESFDVGNEFCRLSTDESGAQVTFIGSVRDVHDGQVDGLSALEIEHYPGMTERCIDDIVDQALERWTLQKVTVIHRIGLLAVGEPIVYVGVASAHRTEAFEACQFIMDHLKSVATFWKKEHYQGGSNRWVDSKAHDHALLSRWK